MRCLIPLLLVALGACASPDLARPSGKARFDSFPGDLFTAFESACSAPPQKFRRPSPEQVECAEFLPPEQTAAIILQFDGTPQDLPQLVVRFSTRPVGNGYEVHNDVFLNVPQKSGPPLQVRQYDAQLQHTLDMLYQRAGGVPLADEKSNGLSAANRTPA